MKDTSSFWLLWNRRFSRRSMFPCNINGCCQDDEIAEIFHTSFSGVQFDSYTDSDEVPDCMQRLQSLTAVERLDGFDKCISLFDVEDVDNDNWPTV